MRNLLCAALAALCAAGSIGIPASAAVIQITATGFVNEISAQGFSVAPDALIKVGDAITYFQTIDTSNYSLFDYGPSLHDYAFLRTTIDLTIGSFHYHVDDSTNGAADFADNYLDPGGYDSQAFGIDGWSIPTLNGADALGVGEGSSYVESAHVAFYGNTGIRSSALITELNDPALYESRKFQYSVGNSSNNRRASVFGDINATVEMVPEASTWAMMLIGFGAIGAAMRQRKAVGASALGETVR